MKRFLFALCLWLFCAMAFSMLLNGLYAFALLPPSAPLFFLPAAIYLCGSLLAAWWARTHLHPPDRSRTQTLQTSAALTISLFLLLLAILFTIKGLQHL